MTREDYVRQVEGKLSLARKRWDREQIVAGLDKRTVLSREVSKVLDLAEDVLHEQQAEHIAEQAELVKQRDVAIKAGAEAREHAEEAKLRAAEAEEGTLKILELHSTPAVERTIRNDALTVTMKHTGVKSARNGGDDKYWWLLCELEDTLAGLRVQGAEDHTKVFVEQQQLRVTVPDIGFLPPPRKPKVETVMKTNPVNVVLWAVTVMFAIGFILQLIF